MGQRGQLGAGHQQHEQSYLGLSKQIKAEIK